MTTTVENNHVIVTVEIAKGRNAGQCGKVLRTYGKQSVVVEGMGTVYRKSLTVKSQRELAAYQAGVTWTWLRDEMSEAEAVAWLGL